MSRRPQAVVIAAVLLSVCVVASLVLLDGPGRSTAAATAPPAATTTPCPDGSETGVFLTGTGVTQLSETDINVCVSGDLTVVFSGSRAAGCAAHGLCAVSGTEVWRPADLGDVSILTFRRDGHLETHASLDLGGFDSPITSVVRVGDRAGATGTCRDRVSNPAGGFFGLTQRGAFAVVGLHAAGAPLLGTDCAGPLDADVRAALPRRTVRWKALRRGHLDVDLSGTRRFSAGGFAGTVDSTLTLKLGTPATRKLPQRIHPVPGVHRLRQTSVSYRITDVSDTASAALHAVPGAACRLLAACGTRTTVTVAPHTRPGAKFTLYAQAPASRPRRDLLTALGLATGGDATGIEVGGVGSLTGTGTLQADVTGSGIRCRDRVRLTGTELLLARHGARLQVSLSPSRSQAGDPLRTRCPGPSLGHHDFTVGSVPVSDLSRPSFTVALHGHSFRDGAYVVTTHAVARVTLRRGQVTTRVLPFASAAEATRP